LTAWAEVLGDLVQQRGAALKRYGYLLCGDSGQDALVRTFTSARHADVSLAEPYVRKIMLNLHLDRARRRKIRQRLLPLAVAPPQADRHAESDLSSDLRRALQDLSPRQRASVVLYYYLDLPVPECADALGVSSGAVKRYLSEARARLAGRLTRPEHASEDGYAT
jgi:RNA polymerase sigma factor (sigma-70 family)